MIGLASGWVALLLIPITAIVGWALRRLARGRFTIRMRPHYFFGYGALVFALVHLSASMGAMGRANATGIWLATGATFALGLQALIGTNLQSPGLYRAPLRRWHLVAFACAAVFAAGHVAYDAPWSPISNLARRVDHRAVVAYPIRLPSGVGKQPGDLVQITALALKTVHDP